MSRTINGIGEENLDSQVRSVLAKPGDLRSYDDLLVLKSRISRMDFMKSVFASLHPRQIDELCKSMNLEIVEEDTFVFRQGEVGDKFYVVLSGSCDVILKQRTGSFVEDPDTGETVEEFVDKVIFTCRPGGQFGERALDFDEPRAASIKATCFTELITITQAAYRKMLKAPVLESALDLPGNKGHTLRILSLTREKRKISDLHAVSEYLSTHVPFFKKFTKDQRLEMCRMCELVKVWGKTVLFKQGSVGQAFYIILTGSVDVVVSSFDDNGDPVDINVNCLREGASFGERSLESDDSLRTATIITSEPLTELIIISRDEYQRIVTVMREGDMMERVQLLRRTQIFSALELPHLHEIARVMEWKIFRLDSTLLTMGELARDVFIIHKGECHLETVLTLENGQEEHVELGRMGPGAVLGEYCLLADSYYDEVLYKESAMATTYCCTFVLSKIDVFHALSEESRLAVIDAVRKFVPPTTSLWDTCQTRISAADWRISQTWKHFQEDIASRKKFKGILEHYRESDASLRKAPQRKHDIISFENDAGGNSSPSPGYTSPKSLVDIPSRQQGPRVDLSPRLGRNSKSESGEPHRNVYSVVLKSSGTAPSVGTRNSHSDHDTPSKGNHLRGELGTNSTLQQFPFSLIQVHRDAMVLRAAKESRRGIKCYVRFCGSMTTGIDAKAAAEAQLSNSAIKFKVDSIGMTGKGTRARGIQWKRFEGFENMPFQHTDHFIIMCRSVPVEYGSFTPNCNLMEISFPPSCKLRCQKYCCVSVNEFRKPNAEGNVPSGSAADMTDTLMPLYSREMSCVSEIHAVTHTKVECLRYAVLTMNCQVETPNATLLVVPLYSWLLISEDLTTTYACSEYLQDSVSSSVAKIEKQGSGGKKLLNSKTASEELRVALQGVGVGSGLHQHPVSDEDEAGLKDAALYMLRRNLKTKNLMDEVDRRLALSGTLKVSTGKDDCRDSRINHGKRSKTTISGSEGKLTTAQMEMERKATISALIEARSRVIALNDELCSEEIELNDSVDRSSSVEYSSTRFSKSSKSVKAHSVSSGGIGRKRVEVLEALQSIPNIKNIKAQSNMTRKNPSVGTTRTQIQQTRSVKETAADRRHNRLILPYLKNKLDLIDDVVYQQCDV